MPNTTKIDLDHIDCKLLDALSADARTSLRQLGELVGLSAPAVRDRIRRLKDEGVIESFTIRLNHHRLGYALEAFVRIEPLPGRLKEIERALQGMPEITHCAVVTGEDCFIARIMLRDIDDLSRLLDPLHDKARTRSSIVKSVPVPARNAPYR
jgi:Lrp/AsnC family leucine-responsive transcriptional regulator